MIVNITEEQYMIKDTVRKLFKGELSGAFGGKAPEHSEVLWQYLANDGWLGLLFPEEYGGSGGNIIDMGIVFEEAGRALVPTTLYSTIYAGLLIASLGSEEQKREHLGRIIRGELVGTVAYAEPDVLNSPARFGTRAYREGDNWVLSGVKAFVSNAHLADPILVAARTGVGLEEFTVFLVPATSTGVEIKPYTTFGGDCQSLVNLNRVRLDHTAILGTEGQAKSGINLAMKQATALQCAEMVGGMQQMLDMTVQYVSERTQFGKPIGSFQAVQHHAANMAIAVDAANLVTYQVLDLLSVGEEADKELAVAKAWTSEAYKSVSLTCHQLWGGMGYALESNLFLWSNRAKATELSFGTRDFHLEHLAELLLGQAQ